MSSGIVSALTFTFCDACCTGVLPFHRLVSTLQEYFKGKGAKRALNSFRDAPAKLPTHV